MEIKIKKENDNCVYFSNGDGIYRGSGIYKNRWLIDSKKRKSAAEEFYKHHPKGVLTTSWFLEALNKKDALEEYQSKTEKTVTRNF